jgi:rubrerythrin
LKKVYLDNLPKYTSGCYKNKIDWKNCVGKEINFVNDDINGMIKILEYNKSKQQVKIQYKDNIYWFYTSSLIDSKISRLTKRSEQRTPFKFKIGDINNNIRIDECFKKDSYKRYKYTCLICGHKGEKNEVDMKRFGCPICNNKRFVDPSINGIKITHPNIYKMIIDKDAEYYSYGSAHKVHWRCPLCNNINFTAIKNLTSDKPTGCSYCGDGISYPEKILYGVLSYISTSYIKQISFDWSMNKKYDAFDNGIFIEIHGQQHYVKSFEKCGGRTLEEEKENDKLKKKLALINFKTIKDYITIKAYPEKFDVIKENILKSNISKFYDVSKINWEIVRKNAESSLVCCVSKDYNDGISINSLSIKYNLSNSTIVRYLHKGTVLGICNYDSNWYNGGSKKVIELHSLKVFISITDAAKWSHGSKNAISKCANEKDKYITSGTNPETGERCRWCFYDDYINDKEKVKRILNKKVRNNQFDVIQNF